MPEEWNAGDVYLTLDYDGVDPVVRVELAFGDDMELLLSAEEARELAGLLLTVAETLERTPRRPRQQTFGGTGQGRSSFPFDDLYNFIFGGFAGGITGDLFKPTPPDPAAERIAKVRELYDRASTPGEKEAARAALERLGVTVD